MARIPLQTANRSLDTGSVVQYPQGSPIGGAIESAGNNLQAIAQRFQQKQDQKDGFDARLRETEFTASLAGLEDQAVQTAPEDAAGLHDGVVGQIDPSGAVVKPGSFDTLFDQYKARVPASQQPDFEAKRESYRLQSSNRMTGAQYAGEQAYYKVQIAKTQDQIINSILAGDPNDTATYEQFKSRGAEIIDKSGMPPLAKDVAKTNWEANASETLFKLKLEKDPAFAENARAALGLAPIVAPSASGGGSAVDHVVSLIIGAESGGNANAQNPRSTAGGLGGFTNSTWVATVRAHRPDIARGMSNDQIIELKKDGPLAREMTTRHVEDNAGVLKQNGYAVTPGNLYLVHFAGAAGGPKLLGASDDTPIASVLDAAAIRANPEVLGGGKTVGEVKAWADRKMGDAASDGRARPTVQISGLPGFAQANSFLKTRNVGHGPDHIDGLKPDMQQRLAAFIQSAPPGMAEKLGIFSGSRTVARQTELWNAALKKYGSAGEARKWVAPPPGVLGSKGSNHNSGAAADLSYDGKSLANAPPEVVKWAHDNAGRFGLAFPLGNENWHVEMTEARSGDPAFSAIPPDRRLVLANLADGKVSENRALLRGGIETTVQNAPIAIQNTGEYSGTLPGREEFQAAYGPQDGNDRYAAFQALIETSQQANSMRTMSGSDINAMVEAAKPLSSGDTAALDQKRYDALAGARDAVMKAREADPSTYTQQVFPTVAKAWQDVQQQPPASRDYQSVLALTAAAQKQLGITNMQLLPNSVAASSVATFKDENRPEQDRIGAVAGLVFSTSNPEQRLAVFDQLVKAGLPDITAGAIRASARGDTGAAQRLFQAAMVDVSKLPGQTPSKPAEIDAAIQTQLMDVNQIGDVYYGLSDGSAENMVAAQRDSKLMTNAVTLRVRKGENLDAAVFAVAKDLFGDVKPVSGANVSILIPSDQDENVVTTGLDAMQPQVRKTLEQTLTIPGEVKGVDSALMNATRANEINRLMLDGYWRNAGDGFAFLDPKTGMAVAGPDGNPLIFSEKEVLAAGGTAKANAGSVGQTLISPTNNYDARTPEPGAGPSLDENGNPVVLGQ